ncbi:MAG TPA: aminotransferase class I/II-fold pyridoxal phosphate-dependent enzyme, partial [Sphingomonas sp.]|nr:aminotransferase class I/II-fold pyridoxal phosphate-dependent enzyme [Sphingomonas sp.]
MNPLYASMPTTIFEHMSARARETGAINLGQGFPDSNGPADVVEAAARALAERSNQYPPMAGLPELREAVAAHYRRHQGLDLAPAEVTVTSGATEALAAAILALVSPGDEVVLFQPLYDAYLPLVRRAGGVPRLVRLAPPDWRITAAVLDAAFTERTRLVILNTPLNPTATLATAEELAL